MMHRAYSPIGLEITDRWIRAVQVRRQKGQRHVKAALAIRRAAPDTPFDGEELARLRGALDRHAFVGERVVLGTPRGLATTTVMEFNESSAPQDVADAVKEQLSRMLRCDITELRSDWWEVPAVPRTRSCVDVIAAGCALSSADSLLNPFDEEGFSVIALDLPSCALSRYFAVLEENDGLSVALSIESGASLLAVLDGEAVLFDRTIPEVGLAAIERTLRDELNAENSVDWLLVEEPREGCEELTAVVQSAVSRGVERIAAEVRKSIDYVEHRYPSARVNRILLAGEGSRVPGLDTRLAELLEFEVKRFALGDFAFCPDELRERCATPALAVAMGLAMYDG